MTASIGRPREDPADAHLGIERGDIPADTFAARLVLVRHHAGRLSIEKAAERCGLNSGNWVRWEDGARPRDRVEVAQAINKGLGIDFNWLLLGGPLLGSKGRPVRRPATEQYPDVSYGRGNRPGPPGHPGSDIGHPQPVARRPKRRPVGDSVRELLPPITLAV